MDWRAFRGYTPRRGTVSSLVAVALHAGLAFAMMNAEAPMPANAEHVVPVELVVTPVSAADSPAASLGRRADLSPRAVQAASAPAPMIPPAPPRARPHAVRSAATVAAPVLREAPEALVADAVAAVRSERADGFLAGSPAGSAAVGAGNHLGSLIGSGRGTGSVTGAFTGGAGGGGACRECDRSHGPRLLRRRDPCAGLFPWQAEVNEGTVTMKLAVTSGGVAHHPEVLAESPRGHGFGRAAASCLSRMRFEPATDRSGKPVASSSVVRLRFAREH